jgi:hypothetical protein
MIGTLIRRRCWSPRREFLKGGALATAALSSGVLAVEPAEAGRVPEDISLDPRRSIVQLWVNGVPYHVEVPNRTTLLRLLREELKAEAVCQEENRPQNKPKQSKSPKARKGRQTRPAARAIAPSLNRPKRRS